MIVIVSRNGLHLLPGANTPEGFKLRRGPNEFETIPHWVRPRLQDYIDRGLMTYRDDGEAKKAEPSVEAPSLEVVATDVVAAEDEQPEAKKRRR